MLAQSGAERSVLVISRISEGLATMRRDCCNNWPLESKCLGVCVCVCTCLKGVPFKKSTQMSPCQQRGKGQT